MKLSECKIKMDSIGKDVQTPRPVITPTSRPFLKEGKEKDYWEATNKIKEIIQTIKKGHKLLLKSENEYGIVHDRKNCEVCKSFKEV